MDWLGNNWIWIVFVVGMIAMHLFGHRGHRHGSGHGVGPDRDEPARADQTHVGDDHAFAPQTSVAGAGGDRNAVPTTTPANRHRHGC